MSLRIDQLANHVGWGQPHPTLLPFVPSPELEAMLIHELELGVNVGAFDYQSVTLILSYVTDVRSPEQVLDDERRSSS